MSDYLSSGIVRKARPAAGALVGLLAGSIVIGLLVLMVQTYGIASSIREAQKTNTATNADSSRSLGLIEDCLSPDGYCATARDEANREQAVVLTRISVFAAACADQPERQTAKAIEACVRRLLAASGNPAGE